MTLEEMEASHKATQSWRRIKASFPYLPKPAVLSRHAEDIYDAVAEVLAATASFGTIAGTGLPAPAIPASERRRHLYIVGKTGSGKSTFLEHLIAQDLAAGRGVAVLSPESGFFRERLIPLVPDERADDLVYLAPVDASCPLTLNPLALDPGEEASRAAQDVATIFRRAFGEGDLGVRGEPIVENLFAALVGQPGVTLSDVPAFLGDALLRQRILEGRAPEEVRRFWEETYPRFPKGSELPILTRLNRFLRAPEVSRVLCQPSSTLSVRAILKQGRILLVDLAGLSEGVRQLLGQLLLARLQLELMRRERASERAKPFFLYADEFQSFGGVDERTWRELLSRGRKYGLALTLAHQYPAQLPPGLQREVRNANSIVAFRIAHTDAESIRGEFVSECLRAGHLRLEPLPASSFVELPVGVAYGSLCGGRAVKIQMPPPLRVTAGADDLVTRSWRRYPSPSEPSAPSSPAQPPPPPPPEIATASKPGAPPHDPAISERREQLSIRQAEAPTTRRHAPAPAARKDILDYLASIARDPFLNTTERDRALGLSAWQGNRLRSQATEAGLVKPVAVNPGGRGRKFRLLELTAAGAELLERHGVKRPVGRGRGGVAHQWWVKTVAAWLSSAGARCSIETEEAGARVDIRAVLPDGRTIAVEIETSDGHEVENIRKDLAAGYEAVVSLVATPAAAQRVERELASEERKKVRLGTVQSYREVSEAMFRTEERPLPAPARVPPRTPTRKRPPPKPTPDSKQASYRPRRAARPETQAASPGDLPTVKAILNTDEAARYLGGISPRTLEGMRYRGDGPPFVRVGRRVAYRREDLDRWIADRTIASTSDIRAEKGKNKIRPPPSERGPSESCKTLSHQKTQSLGQQESSRYVPTNASL